MNTIRNGGPAVGALAPGRVAVFCAVPGPEARAFARHKQSTGLFVSGLTPPGDGQGWPPPPPLPAQNTATHPGAPSPQWRRQEVKTTSIPIAAATAAAGPRAPGDRMPEVKREPAGACGRRRMTRRHPVTRWPRPRTGVDGFRPAAANPPNATATTSPSRSETKSFMQPAPSQPESSAKNASRPVRRRCSRAANRSVMPAT